MQAATPTPFESATLNLTLFDLRREPLLREARQWFLAEFNPKSFGELVTVAGGAQNATFRMVLGYWDMAASLVTTGAIDGEAFLAAHAEIFLTSAKVCPILSELAPPPASRISVDASKSLFLTLPSLRQSWPGGERRPLTRRTRARPTLLRRPADDR